MFQYKTCFNTRHGCINKLSPGCLFDMPKCVEFIGCDQKLKVLTSKPDCKKEPFDLKRQIRNDSCNNRLTILTTCNEKKCYPTCKLDKNADYVKDTKVQKMETNKAT